MGNQTGKSQQEASAFVSYRIKDSGEKKILNLHLQADQFPSSGVIIAGCHCKIDLIFRH